MSLHTVENVHSYRRNAELEFLKGYTDLMTIGLLTTNLKETLGHLALRETFFKMLPPFFVDRHVRPLRTVALGPLQEAPWRSVVFFCFLPVILQVCFTSCASVRGHQCSRSLMSALRLIKHNEQVKDNGKHNAARQLLIKAIPEQLSALRHHFASARSLPLTPDR